MADTLVHVAALIVGTSLNKTTRSLMLVAVVALSTIVLLILRPHRFKATLRLEVLGACSNTLALLLLTIANDDSNMNLQNSENEDQEGIVTAVIVIEVLTIVWFLAEIIRTARHKMVNTFKQVAISTNAITKTL